MSEIHWLNPISGSFTNAADWSGGVVPGAGDDAILNAPGGSPYTVTVSASGTVNSIQTAVDATLDVGSGAAGQPATFTALVGTGAGANTGTIVLGGYGFLTVGGTLNNTGLIALRTVESQSGIEVLSTGATLTGGGTVTLSQTNGSVIDGYAGATLTNINNTIAGTGHVGGAGLSLVNEAQGVIDATGVLIVNATAATAMNNAGLIEQTGAGALYLYGPIDNTGTIRDAGSGTMIIKGTIVDSEGATLAPGTNLQLHSGEILGGVLATAVGQTITVGGYEGGFYAYSEIATTTLTNAGEILVDFGQELTLQGLVDNTGAIQLMGGLRVGAAGVSLTGGGSVTVDGGYPVSIGGSGTLTNVSNTFTGGGTVGSQVAFVNGAKGVVDATGALTFDASGFSVTNAGLIEATGTGSVTFENNVNNTGTLEADGGTLYIDGAVTGPGMMAIAAGDLYLNTASVDNVAFTGTSGILFIAQSQDYTGTVTGFSTSGGTALDLEDIGFVNPGEASFSGTTSGGTLTVTDGIHTAHIALAGNYEGADFSASTDGQSGTTIIVSPQIPWAKAASGAFSDAANWSGAMVPGAHDAAILSAAGGAFTVTSNVSETVNSIETAPNAILAITGGFFAASSGTGDQANGGTIVVGNDTGFTVAGALDNIGAIDLECTGVAGALMEIESNTTLSGGGHVVMSDNVDNAILGVAFDATLTNVDNTITGAGVIGESFFRDLVLVNEASGVIDATGTNPLTIDTGANVITNAGVIEATGSGGIVLMSAVNNSGLIEVGTAAMASVLTIEGVVPFQLNGQLNGNVTLGDNPGNRIDGSGILFNSNTLSGAGTIGAPTLAVYNDATGIIDANGNNSLTVKTGSSSNAGLIEVTGAGGLVLEGTFVNTGQIMDIGSGALTLSSGEINDTTRGTLTPGANLILTNEEILGGAMTLSTGQTITVNAAGEITNVGVTSQGDITVQNDGNLTISNTFVNDYAGGVVQVGDGSQVDLQGGILAGGALETVGTGSIRAIPGVTASSLEGITSAIQNQGTVVVESDATLILRGTIGNIGELGLAGIANVNAATLLVGGTVTLTGGGIVSLSASLENKIEGAGAGAALTNVNNTISGAGDLGGGDLALTNQAGGIIDASAASWLVLYTGAATITNAGLIEATGSGGLSLRSTVNNAGGGRLSAAGGNIYLQGSDIQGGTLSATDGKIIYAKAGVDTLDGTASAVNVAGRVVVDNGENLNLVGAIDNTSLIQLLSDGTLTTLTIGAAGAILTGGGQVFLGNDNAAAHVVGASAASTLDNVANVIAGAGDVGGGELTLVNGAAGVIVGEYAVALIVDTGANTIVNAGRIENSGKGGTLVKSAVVNTGGLIAEGGTLTLDGAVTGSGEALIYSGTLDFASSFSQLVAFKATTGVLELAQSQSYAGTVYGFSTTGGTSLDLGDITYGGSTTASYSGTASGGTLTVTDGTHTAHIKLVGDYLASTFTASSDGHGGTTIVDPPKDAPAAPPHAFIAAMAAMAGPAGVAIHSGAPWPVRQPMLARPHTMVA